MKVSNFLIFIAAVVFVLISLSTIAQSESDKTFRLVDFSPTTLEIICSDNEFLRQTGLSNESCTERAEKYTERCLGIAQPLEELIVMDDIDLSDAENFEYHPVAIQFQSLATLYGTCIQSYILRATLTEAVADSDSAGSDMSFRR